MSTAIELAFVVFGLFALCWAIMSPSAGLGSRAAAGAFGILALRGRQAAPGLVRLA